MLEHVDDIGPVIGEIARTLKPGGVFCYDTVNRTWWSKVALIKISQDWSFASWSQPNVHVWEKFIKPEELITVMKRHKFANQDLRGISFNKNPLTLVGNLRAIKKGRMSNREIAAAFALSETEDLRISYMGYAIGNS